MDRRNIQREREREREREIEKGSPSKIENPLNYPSWEREKRERENESLILCTHNLRKGGETSVSITDNV